MKKRSDNRGFTLVEIIIAVAILAIALSPLVANFIQSSKLNLKGRETLNAMNLAQDMMEGISGSTAEEVVTILENYIDDPLTAKSLAGTIFPGSTTVGTATRTSADGEAKLVYQFGNVETINSARNKYNVKMTLDPTGTNQAKFNGKEYAAISEVNQYYDAIYNYNAEEVKSAVDEIAKLATKTYDKANYFGKIKRTIKIQIMNTGTETAPQYKVKVTKLYEPTLELVHLAGLPADTIKSVEPKENISKMDPDKLPRSVYLYYEGILNSTYLAPLDNIEIENTTGKKMDVYLVRTQRTSDPNKNVYGQNYGCNVRIVSKDMDNNETEDVHIVSNLRYDLNAAQMRYNFRTEDEDGNTITIAEADYPLDDAGTPMKTSSYKKERATYIYNGSPVDESLYQSNFSAGYAKEKKNTLYKILIEVFDTNSNKVATYDGGLSN